MSGSDNYTSEISNCYNTGKITSDRIVGGIAGSVNGENNNIKYCYNIGSIEGTGSSYFKGSIVGNKWSAIIQDCYYSNTSGIKAVENEDDETNNVYGLTDQYMQSAQFVNLLNSGNEETVWKLGDSNYQYPMLAWQEYTGEVGEDTVLKGDVNEDNLVDFMDILQINKHRLGKTQLTGTGLEAADVNEDGNVDFMDILQINRYRLGKINSL